MVSSAMLPAMRAAGYKPAYSAAVTASAAVLGPIMPPSVPMVFVSLITALSLGQLFIGGIVPAILIAIVLFGIVALQASRAKLPEKVTAPQADPKHLGTLLVRALPALGAPVFIVVGVIGG